MALSAAHPVHVLVLTHRSLLAGGLVARFEEYANTMLVDVLDFEAPSLVEHVTSLSPEIIILDAGDSNICQKLPIVQLLEWAPRARIMRIDLLSETVRIFSSFERHISQVSELVDLITNTTQADRAQ